MTHNRTTKTAVIGHPVGHSKSPMIHSYWIERYGLDAEYTAIDIMPERLEKEIESLANEGYAGFNVTVPHKQAVMTLCDTLDETARAVGAVNTVIIGENGTLAGRNTDAFGFMENLCAEAPEYRAARGPAVVLGAGGAARAVVHALLTEGVPDLVLVNRTRARAEALAAESAAPERITIADWSIVRGGALKDAALLVNTTSAGMAGADELDVDTAPLPGHAVVCDIVYIPLMTGLLKNAQANGLKTVTGIGMLLHQARPAFEAWHGILPDVTGELTAKVMA